VTGVEGVDELALGSVHPVHATHEVEEPYAKPGAHPDSEEA
jgi:hypothetical protein